MRTPGEGAFCACGSVYHLTRRATVECGLCGRQAPTFELYSQDPDGRRIWIPLSELAAMLAPLIGELRKRHASR
jgi:hypothetical protein